MKSILTPFTIALALLTVVVRPSTAVAESPASSQVLELDQGWNLVALTVRPNDVSLASILSPILEDVVIVTDPAGRTMVPRMQIDEIGEWDLKSAYHIFARNDVSLTIPGPLLDEEDIVFELDAGWNTVPFVGSRALPVGDMFNDGVVLVRNDAGHTYWPEHEIDEIGELVPGVGYKVFVSDQTVARLPKTPEKPVYHVPDHIDATGAKDVTALVNEFIATVPDNSIIQFAEDGRYRIDETVRVRDRHGLIFQNGFFFTDVKSFPDWGYHRNRARSHWSIEGGSDIVIRDMTIRGPHPNGGTDASAYVMDLEAQHGINIWSTKHVLIENNVITDVYGDFLYIGSQHGGWALDVIIRGNTLERNGRQGIAITGGDEILIEDNHIQDVRRSVFDLEANGNTGGATNVTIRGNYVGAKRLTWLANGGSGSNIRNILIESNTSSTPMNIAVHTPEGHRRGPYKIINNVSTKGYGTPNAALMTFRRVDGVEVWGNVHPLQRNRNMHVARLDDVTDIDIRDNEYPGGVGEYFFIE